MAKTEAPGNSYCYGCCLHKNNEAKWFLLQDLSNLWKQVAKERTVHPDCINASNPYHDCSQYCLKKIAGTKADLLLRTLERATLMDKSNPNCVNSSNPLHECSDYPLHKTGRAKWHLLDGMPDSLNHAVEKRTVYRGCINASNPCHDCSDYCFKKIVDTKADPPPRIREHTAVMGMSNLECINSSNPYHECSEYCFKKIADSRACSQFCFNKNAKEETIGSNS